MGKLLTVVVTAALAVMGLSGIAAASPDGDNGLDRIHSVSRSSGPVVAEAAECPYNITAVSDRVNAIARQAVALSADQQSRFYLAGWQKVHDDMSPACRAEMFWEAVALLKARTEGKYLRRDGRELYIVACPDCDNEADRALEAEQTRVEDAARYERDLDIAAGSPDPRGWAYEMWQNINQMRNAIIAVAGIAIVSSAAYPSNVTLQQVRDALMRTGYVFVGLDLLAQTIFNTLSNGGGGSGKSMDNPDPCKCGGDH